jgi:DNA-binding NarL/FixJ family response regulator
LRLDSALVDVPKLHDSAASAISPRSEESGRITLVADPVCAARIEKILDPEGWMIERLENVESLIKLPHERRPALIVLWIGDAALGKTAPIEAVTRTHPQVPLVVVCRSIERWTARAALAAGAAGIVTSEDFEAGLRSCIQAVLAGQTCVPRQYWRQIDPPALSSREKQILGLVVMGYMNSQIAGQLFLAESTVKSHLSSAFGKLGVRSRNEAVSVILDRDRGLGTGILSLVGDPEMIDSNKAAAR